MDVRGSVAIVTGASSGIGEATARALARAGATVVLAARRADELQRLAAEIEREGGRALAVPTDMTSRQAIERLVGVTVETFGRIDIVVNNAGIGGGGSILDDSDELMERVVSVNLLAPARLVQAALPHIRRQDQNGKQGHGQGRERGVIVNVGSVAGDVATSGMYAASKFGLRGLNDALRRELLPSDIAVVLIAPGFIRTPMTRGVRVPMPGPDAVARAILSGIQEPRRRITVPWPYVLPSVFARAFPGLVDHALGSPVMQRRYHDRERS